LARKTESHFTATDINRVLCGLAELLKQTLPKTIDISLELRPKLPAVMADSNQINQALLNTCVNARDAMPNGGKITLRTRICDGREIKDDATREAPYVCVEVSDSGMGMDDDVRKRMFEPFFTTKGIGEGTGLGLAIVYGIIKNHQGSIEVESEPGHGATFRLYLPVAPSEGKQVTDEVRSTKISDRKSRNGQRTVLLVEDEEMMVLLLRNSLSRHGYNVLVALDGDQAIDLFHHHKHQIDVVLLDIGLPKRAGWDVILKIKEENPRVHVVVSSGYIDPESRAKMHQAGVRDFIDKPYTSEALLETLDAFAETH
jgi:CheY-like chemotaxis protein